MRNYPLSIGILADTLHDLIAYEANGDSSMLNLLKQEIPSVSNDDALKIAQLLLALHWHGDEEHTEIVVTAPISFKVKARKTRPVIKELLMGAEASIQLTGYSISDHFEDFLKVINDKSKRGVVVELFVNDYEKASVVLRDIQHKNRRFFKVYSYSKKPDDRMAALHAKTIIVDGSQTLISSANQSYHGLDGNIELGALITSRKKAAQIQEILSELKRQKVFVLVE